MKKWMTPLSICFLFATISQAQMYCPAKGNFPWEQWNERVSISNRIGSSIYPITGKEGYGNFASLIPAKMLRGDANLITISPISSWDEDPRNKNMFWRAWVDFNNDGDFTDANEQVISRQVVYAGGFLDNEQAFTVPSLARLGNTRMRIAMKVGGYPEPCETFDRGEVEDYTVQIVDVNTGKDTLRLVGVTGDTSVRQGGQVRLNVTISNTGTAASDPTTPLSIYQNQQPFAFKGPQPLCFQNVSNRVPIGRSILPNETVTLPYTFTMASDFTNISPLVIPSIEFGQTNVTIGNRNDSYCQNTFISGYVGDTLFYPFKINALLDNSDLVSEIMAVDSTYGLDGVFNFTVKITNKGNVKVRSVATNIISSPISQNQFTFTTQRGTVTSTFFFGTYYNIWNVSEMAAGESLTAQVRVVDPVVAGSVTSIVASANVTSNQIMDINSANNQARQTFTHRNSSCRYQDSLQLVRLYNSTNGANWTNKWNLNTPINTWYGVELNADGCVTGIGMENNNLEGILPNLDMPNLVALNLRVSKLRGTLPNFNTPNLQYLYITDSQITGAVPNFNMPNLRVVFLYANQLTGAVPNFNAPNLEALLIDGNKLSGQIPNFNHPKMIHLALSYNQLTGTIPDFNFPVIERLFLDNNQLSGCIPLSMKAFCGKNVSFINNLNLVTQDFNAFCSSNIGACNSNIDMAVSITATPSVFVKYSTINYNISVKNIGNQAFTNIKIEFKFPQGTVTGGTATANNGRWEEWCSGGLHCFSWSIPNLNPNQTAVLTVPLFVLDVNTPIVATAKLLSSTPTDNNVINNQASVTIMPAAAAPNIQSLVNRKPTQFIPIVIQNILPSIANDEIMLNIESIVEKTIPFEMYNAFGKLVQTDIKQVQKGENQVIFDVHNLPQGLYIIIPTTVFLGKNAPSKFIKM